MTSTPVTEEQETGPKGIYGASIYPQTRRKTIRMREAGWRQQCSQRGIHSDNALGSLLRYNHSHVYRVRVGQSVPGAEFIATAMTVFGCKFEDLFEVVDRGEGPIEEDLPDTNIDDRATVAAAERAS